MNPYIRIALLSSLLGPLFAACTNDTEPISENNGKKLMTFECLLGTTRATDTEFEAGDQIGVYVVGNGSLIQPAGNEVNNKAFSFNGSAWISADKAYWNEGSFDVFAYYPYTSTITDTENYEFSVREDQSSHEGYTASDFLWASKDNVTASANPVTLQFSHKLSKVVISLEKGEGYEGEIPADCEVYIHSTATQASVDLMTGDAATSLYSPTNTIKCYKENATAFKAVVVPQNISSRRPLVEVVAQGVSYLMEGKISFKPGYSHNIIITLTKNPEQTKIEIGGSIGEWD